MQINDLLSLSLSLSLSGLIGQRPKVSDTGQFGSIVAHLSPIWNKLQALNQMHYQALRVGLQRPKKKSVLD